MDNAFLMELSCPWVFLAKRTCLKKGNSLLSDRKNSSKRNKIIYFKPSASPGETRMVRN